MKFVTAKDFRAQASSIWADLPGEQEVVITLNGKPVAIMTATNDKDFEQSLRAIRRARMMEAVSSLQQTSVQSGRDKMTEKEIETEIKRVRIQRR